ncbi:unnamed protein product [Lymnaea stagnalis]|uniref:Nicotinamide riboside kinase 1 n=1 Tax=Lymnaea stagnalis TaxID=6523 RepID=A0AAV2GZG3_LYMST
MGSRNFLIIGLSGITNSGKTTVASMLCKALPHLELMCQDSYFWDLDNPSIERDADGVINWEKLSALDMERMVRDVRLWSEKHDDKSNSVKKYSVLLIEGFLIFNDRKLSALFDHKYFIKINKEICKERRLTRVYIPPDPSGYFDNVVWPMSMHNLELIQDQDDIEYIDGMVDLNTLYQKILAKIQLNIETQH